MCGLTGMHCGGCPAELACSPRELPRVNPGCCCQLQSLGVPHLDYIRVQLCLSHHQHIVQQLLPTPVARHRRCCDTSCTHAAGQEFGGSVLPGASLDWVPAPAGRQRVHAHTSTSACETGNLKALVTSCTCPVQPSMYAIPVQSRTWMLHCVVSLCSACALAHRHVS
jgi:hypothetical protein